MSGQKVTAVEGLRFLLFLGVFLFHCSIDWFSMAWGGGVQAFLVIGSYFMTYKYLKSDGTSIKIGNSLFHRVKRLYPVYITIVLIVTVFFIVRKGKIITDSLWYVFIVQNFRCLFDGVGRSLEGCLGHFWYIGLDIWLFVIWIVLLRFVSKKHLKIAFIVSLCIGLAWRTCFIIFRPDNIALSYVIPIGQLDCWSIGGLIALNVKEKGLNSRIMWVDIIIGLVGLISLIVLNSIRKQCDFYTAYKLFSTADGYMDSPIIGNIHLFKGFLAAGLLRYCLDMTKKHVILSSKPMVALGGMTYELYCIHLPMLFVFNYFVKNKLIMVVTAMIATYVVSLFWCKLIDPLLKKVIK